MNNQRRTVLVVAAHPDDEILGCGGTIASHTRAGDEVIVALLAQGLYSRGNPDDAMIRELTESARRANEILGVKALERFEYPDNRMDSVARLEVTQTVEKLVATYQPAMVYTHHSGDVNVDHRRVHDAVVTACRPQPRHPVREILFFEVVSSTEWAPPCSRPVFAPNWFVDITESLVTKLAALDEYKQEMREFPHPRSIQAVQALAQWRGATVGVAAAEAFELGRRLAVLRSE